MGNIRMRTISPRDAGDRIFRNDGPIEPVVDVDAAHTMAKAELAVFDMHKRRWNGRLHSYLTASDQTEYQEKIDELTSRRDETPWAEMNAASERSRIRIAKEHLGVATVLYSLTELETTPDRDQVVLLGSSPATAPIQEG